MAFFQGNCHFIYGIFSPFFVIISIPIRSYKFFRTTLLYYSSKIFLLNLAITLPTNRAKLEPFDKTNAENPHKYRLSAF